MTQIYLHGLGQTPASWDPLLRLMDAPEDPLLPDLTKLVPAGDTTYPALYSAIAQRCDQADAPLALCGLSLGGVLALQYAAEHPARVGALVLLAPQYRMPTRLLRLQNALFRLMPPSCFRETGFTKAQFLQLCRSMMDLDLTPLLSHVSCPVLVLCGSRDRANKRACAALVQRLPQATLHLISGAGHECNRDAPEALATLLRQFFPQARKASPQNPLKPHKEVSL